MEDIKNDDVYNKEIIKNKENEAELVYCDYSFDPPSLILYIENQGKVQFVRLNYSKIKEIFNSFGGFFGYGEIKEIKKAFAKDIALDTQKDTNIDYKEKYEELVLKYGDLATKFLEFLNKNGENFIK